MGELEELVKALVRLLTNNMQQQVLEVKAQQNRMIRDLKLVKVKAEQLSTFERISGDMDQVQDEMRQMKSEVLEMKQLARSICLEKGFLQKSSSNSTTCKSLPPVLLATDGHRH